MRNIIHRLLNGYTLGADGLYYKRLEFGKKVEIICRQPDGKTRYVQHLEQSQVGSRIDCRTTCA